MDKGIEEDMTLGRYAHGGYCVGHNAEGKVVMVRDGLPGEDVTIEYTAQKSKVSFGRVIAVHKPNSQRQAHVWPEAVQKQLGGVELGHVSPNGQKAWKSAVMRDCARSIGSPELLDSLVQIWDGTVQSVGYELPGRTRVEFNVDQDGHPAMYKANSRQLVAIDQMPLAVQSIDQLEIFSGKWDFLPGSRLRVVAPSASAPVVLIDGVAYKSPGVQVSNRVLEKIDTSFGTLTYRLYAKSFWQAHRLAPKMLIENLGEMINLKEFKHVLELYSGSGLFTLWLAKVLGSDCEITAWEGSKPAVRSAEYNLSHFAPQARASVQVQNINERNLRSLPSLDNYLVLADPPRRGMGEKSMRQICAKAPLRIALISCDPAAGSRDIQAAMDCGYKLSDFRLLDLFSHTHHFETISILSRG